MLKWYNKGWHLEVRYWGISFWTPKTQYFFGWWNPFTRKVLIYGQVYYDAIGRTVLLLYLYPWRYNRC